jgi:hypothetical protein
MLSLLDLTLAVVPTLKFDFYNRMVTGLLEISSMFRAFKRWTGKTKSCTAPRYAICWSSSQSSSS